MIDLERDDEPRAATFAFVENLRLRYGGRIPHDALSKGITFRGQRVPIWNYQKRIFKPAYLVAVDPRVYDAIIPVYVTNDDPVSLQFTLVADQIMAQPGATDTIAAARRESAESRVLGGAV